MYGKCLLIASPLVATLALGTVDISQASVVPTSVSAGDSHITATLKVAPPVCNREFAKGSQLRGLCSRGWSEGYTAGQATCESQQQPRGLAPELKDAAYELGFNAGFKAGKAAC
ncbi:hypothetical protein AB0B45_13865 [Nonomuraea sp. NPDC049152]|uniref:hypothetical protein n=1 Tax=Nonomuraea sp. NPDC049152 TaxID=3154350 RepID=UPI0034003387